MIYTIMTRHRFTSDGLADPELKKFVEHIDVTNGEIAEKIVDMLKRRTFKDGEGRRRLRYGERGVKLVSQD